MRRLAALAAAVVLFAGLAATTPAADAAPTHTNTQVRNVCTVIDEALVSGDPPWQYNNIGLAYYGPLHGFGLHWAQCCLYNLTNGESIYALYLFGWADVDYPQGDPYCNF